MASDRAPAFALRRNVRLLYVLAIVSGPLPFLPVWVIYLTDLRGLTLAQVGLLEAFFWGVAIVSEVPTGAFADRFGRRLTMVAAMAVQAAALALFGLAATFPLLLASYVLWAVGIALHSGNHHAYVYEALAAGGRERGFTELIGRLMAVETGAIMVGSVFGAALAATTTLQLPILLSAATFAAAVPIALAMQEPPRPSARVASLGYVRTLVDAGGALRRDPALSFMLLLSASFAIAGAGGLLLQQPFLQRHGVPIAAFGLLLAPIQLAGILGSLAAHRIPGRAFVLAQGALFVVPGVAVALMGVVDHVGAFAAFAVFSLAIHIRTPIAVNYLNRRTRSEVRATVLSVEQLGRSLVFALLLPLVGLLAERSIMGTLGGLGLLFLAVASAAYALWLRAERAQTHPAERGEAAGD